MVKTKMYLIDVYFGDFYKSNYFNSIFFKNEVFILDSEININKFYNGLYEHILDNKDEIIKMIKITMLKNKNR